MDMGFAALVMHQTRLMWRQQPLDQPGEEAACVPWHSGKVYELEIRAAGVSQDSVQCPSSLGLGILC